MANIPRCRCGNKVPREELKATGLCRACTREKREKLEAQAEAADREARIQHYRDTLSFWR